MDDFKEIKQIFEEVASSEVKPVAVRQRQEKWGFYTKYPFSTSDFSGRKWLR